MAGSSIWAPVGEQGPPGPTGPTGSVGPAGPQGAPGLNMQDFLDFKTDLTVSTDPLKGAALVTRGLVCVDSVYDLQFAKKDATQVVFTTAYHLGWSASAVRPVGGGKWKWKAGQPKSSHNGGTVVSPTVPWDGSQATLPGFLAGSGEVAPGTNGCWVRVYNSQNAFMYGARGDGASDDWASIQKAMDSAKFTKLLAGFTYRITNTLLYKNNGTKLRGEDISSTIISASGAFPIAANDLPLTTSRLFCEISQVQLLATSIGANNILNWKSFQKGKIDQVWFFGQAVLGCVGINLESIWPGGPNTTECTYNRITDCYFGNVGIGIKMGDGANNNTIRGNRFQIPVSGGIGVWQAPTVAGRGSSNTICDNGFEYPGQVSTGINIQQNSDSTRIYDNRFEALSSGIIIGATGNRNIEALRTKNYFSGCAIPINLSTGATASVAGIIASVAFDGTVATPTIFGNAFNFTVTKAATGTYNLAFIEDILPSNGYTINANSIQNETLYVSPTTSGFQILTRNASSVLTDSPLVSVTVSYNR